MTFSEPLAWLLIGCTSAFLACVVLVACLFVDHVRAERRAERQRQERMAFAAWEQQIGGWVK